MKIHEKPPVIFTKDREWATKAKGIDFIPGAIIVLPEDAILVEAYTKNIPNEN